MGKSELKSYQYDRVESEYECFEINGSEYRVRMFDAFTGVSVAKTAWKNLLGGTLPEGTTLSDLFMVLSLKVLTEEELEKLMHCSMKVCEKRLKSGWTEVVDKSGHFQVPEIEHDSAAAFLITKHAVVFGTSSFFTALSSALK